MDERVSSERSSDSLQLCPFLKWIHLLKQIICPHMDQRETTERSSDSLPRFIQASLRKIQGLLKDFPTVLKD